MFACTYICALCVYLGPCRDQKRVPEPLELDLEVTESPNVSAGTQTWVLSKHSLHLSHLSGLFLLLLLFLLYTLLLPCPYF